MIFYPSGYKITLLLYCLPSRKHMEHVFSHTFLFMEQPEHVFDDREGPECFNTDRSSMHCRHTDPLVVNIPPLPLSTCLRQRKHKFILSINNMTLLIDHFLCHLSTVSRDKYWLYFSYYPAAYRAWTTNQFNRTLVTTTGMFAGFHCHGNRPFHTHSTRFSLR